MVTFTLMNIMCMSPILANIVNQLSNNWLQMP